MPAITAQTVTLTGELVAWKCSASDGWGRGTIQTDVERVDVMGKLVGVRVGETVELEGSWDTHPTFGLRLKVRRCTPQQPESAEGIVAWLVSTLPGVGETRARQLVERFGRELWDVIESRHHALCQVEGITPRRAEAIRTAYVANKANRDGMVALRGWGMTDGQIARCVEQWHSLSSTIEHVRENPYQLSQYVYGFGFKRADVVAMKAGVKFDSPYRIAAGVDHVLHEQSGEGHCYLPYPALRNMTMKLLGVQAEQVDTAIRGAIRAKRAVQHGMRIYTSRMDEAEQQLADALKSLLQRRAA